MSVEEVSQPVLPESLVKFLGRSRVAGVEFGWMEPEDVFQSLTVPVFLTQTWSPLGQNTHAAS